MATRNKADQLVHATRTALKEHGGKVPADQLSSIEGALSDLDKVKDGEDKAAIEAKVEKLEQVAQALYAAAQGTGAGDAGAQSAPSGSAQPDDVVDAEFTEVKDNK